MDETAWDTGDVFDNGEVLSEAYTPEEIPERSEETSEMVKGLRRVFRGEAPKNMFLHGKTGQGKTATARFVLDELETQADHRGVDVETVFVSCRNHSSSYHVACDIVQEYTGEDPNGFPQQTVFEKLFDVLEDLSENVVLVFDEIDSIGSNDDILYALPRARDNGDIVDTHVGIIGITNDTAFLRNIERRAKSSLYDKEIRFDAYDASDLRSILERRVAKAFEDDVVTTEAINLCAAYAAQDEGSARQAIEYMYEAGDIADFNGENIVKEGHIKAAKEQVHQREVTQSISGLTIQDQLALVSVVALEVSDEAPSRTRDVYTEYSHVTSDVTEMNTLSFDRMREHLKELELIGILSKEVRTGDERGGKKYFWELDVDLQATIDVLEEANDVRISDCTSYIAEDTGSDTTIEHFA